MRWIVFIAASFYAAASLAGMPSLTLSDAANLRLSGISFFLLLLLVTAAGFQLVWNYLRRDFGRLPYLTYRMSLAAVLLLGLLFNIILLMIAGTRELMTPGAWEKSGITYKLRDKR